MDISKVLPGWEIAEFIGEGAFGKVYKITREDDFGHTYESALKVITIPANKGELMSVLNDGFDEESATMYFRGMVEDIVEEFVLMSKLRGNTNIVSYEDHAVIRHQEGIGWDIYIRMELLTPLFDHVKDHSMSIRDVIILGIDMCQALEVCQRYNIIHRDIKPENIFVSNLGRYKLGDFGIARQLEKTSSGLSKKGTFSYMAPEVYKGEEYNSTVDIYSLGIVLYRFLNQNRTPFLPPYPEQIRFADREKANILRFSGEKMKPPCNAKGRLAEIILKACAYNPKERYESAQSMREALQGILYSEKEKELVYPTGDELKNEANEYIFSKNSADKKEESIDIIQIEDGGREEQEDGKTRKMSVNPGESEDKIKAADAIVEAVRRETEEEQDVQKKALEEKKQAEAAAKKEAEAKMQAEAAAKKEAEAKKQAEELEVRKRAQEEKKQAEAAAKKEAEAKKKTEEEARKRAAEEKRQAEAAEREAKKRALEEKKQTEAAAKKEAERKKQKEQKSRENAAKEKKHTEKTAAGKNAEEKTKEKNLIYIVAAAVAVLAVAGIILSSIIKKNNQTEVPSFFAITLQNAETLAAENGLVITQTSEDYSDIVKKGAIISQNVEAGTTVKKETAIEVVISLGKKTAEIPEVIGLTEEEARKALEQEGFSCEFGKAVYSDSVEEGKVISQSPEAKTAAEEKTVVTLVLSKGAEPVTVPDVVGMTEQEAKDALKSAGLKSKSSEEEDYNDSVEAGRVTSQNVAVGESVAPGTKVKISISKGPAPKEEPAEKPATQTPAASKPKTVQQPQTQQPQQSQPQQQPQPQEQPQPQPESQPQPSAPEESIDAWDLVN